MHVDVIRSFEHHTGESTFWLGSSQIFKEEHPRVRGQGPPTSLPLPPTSSWTKETILVAAGQRKQFSLQLDKGNNSCCSWTKDPILVAAGQMTQFSLQLDKGNNSCSSWTKDPIFIAAGQRKQFLLQLGKGNNSHCRWTKETILVAVGQRK
ncbi:hypothetical protein TNCV_2402271 [Trichonephila clavipes]|nr:hypothetical protein TNCV_2402271 [Trichonephila clavipes]